MTRIINNLFEYFISSNIGLKSVPVQSIAGVNYLESHINGHLEHFDVITVFIFF